MKREHVIGFYRDERGRTKPITRSNAELSCKKIIEKPRKFKGIQPEETLIRKLKRIQLELEKIGRKLENVSDEKEALMLTKLAEAKFQEAEKIEKTLFKA